jgi:hypothetical protein
MIAMDILNRKLKKSNTTIYYQNQEKKNHQMSCFSGPKVVLLRNWRCDCHIFLESGEHKLSHSSIANSKGKI